MTRKAIPLLILVCLSVSCEKPPTSVDSEALSCTEQPWLVKKLDPSGYLGNPVWVPGGSLIGFESNKDDGNTNIWKVDYHKPGDIEAETAMKFIDLGDNVHDIEWSYDGMQVVYALGWGIARGELPKIYVANGVTGRDARPVAYGYAPTWSPDNRTIAFTTFDAVTGYPALHILNTSHLALPVTLHSSPLTMSNPSWSPDTSRIAFSMENSDLWGRSLAGRSIWVYDFKKGTAEQVTPQDKVWIYDYYDDYPSWAPDGRRIIYETKNDGEGTSFDLCITDITQQFPKRVRITSTDDQDHTPNWRRTTARDEIVFLGNGRIMRMYLCEGSGRHSGKLVSGPRTCLRPPCEIPQLFAEYFPERFRITDAQLSLCSKRISRRLFSKPQTQPLTFLISKSYSKCPGTPASKLCRTSKFLARQYFWHITCFSLLPEEHFNEKPKKNSFVHCHNTSCDLPPPYSCFPFDG
ncbi:MAG: hypothetical protein QME66_02945 [Candidatus Eisenbacteria bacterium]|nr:hypothetical protein [Candidatus Eisenbacteria bacterium]